MMNDHSGGNSGSRPTAYDRFSDTIDQKMLDFNLKLLALLCTLIWKPLAICTDPFFRKNFGERYLTGASIFVSIVLWGIAERLSKVSNYLDNPFEHLLYDYEFYKTADWIHAHNVSGKVATSIAFAYGFIAVTHLAWTLRRRTLPGRWYSMSRGESIFGSENKLRDFIITALAIIAFSVFAPPVGFLFFCSRLAGAYMTTKQEQSFYNKYLNLVDKRIETELLQRALDAGQPPQLTDGLYAPLPKSFKGEHRTNIAKIIAPEDDGKQLPSSSPATARPETESFLTMCKIVYGERLQQRFAFLTQHRKSITYTLVGVIGVVLCVKAIDYIQSRPPRAQTEPTPATPTVSQSSSKPSPKVAPGAITKPTFNLPPSAPQPEAAVEPVSLKQSPAEIRQADEARAKAEAVAAAKKKEREEGFKRIEDAVVAQLTIITNFQEVCQNRIANNTNRIEKLTRSARNELGSQNQRLGEIVRKLMEVQTAALNRFNEALRPLVENSQVEPTTIANDFTSTIGKMEQDRKRVMTALDGIDAEIAKSPKAGKLLFFK